VGNSRDDIKANDSFMSETIRSIWCIVIKMLHIARTCCLRRKTAKRKAPAVPIHNADHESGEDFFREKLHTWVGGGFMVEAIR
jgi:hypothetical protein